MVAERKVVAAGPVEVEAAAVGEGATIENRTYFGMAVNVALFPDGTERLAEKDDRLTGVVAYMVGRLRLRAWSKIGEYASPEQAKAALAIRDEIRADVDELHHVMFNSSIDDVRIPGIGVGHFSPRDVAVRFSETFTSEGDVLKKMGFTKTGKVAS